jgi:hypothetical protein
MRRRGRKRRHDGARVCSLNRTGAPESTARYPGPGRGLVQFPTVREVETLEVDSIGLAVPADAVPTEPTKRGTAVAHSSASQHALDLDGIFGRWPGDESDERLLEALRELA